MPMDAGNAMLGNMEKAKRYLWLASENERRASETSHPPLKALFLNLASEYRNMAQQIDDPGRWRAKHVALEAQASGALLQGYPGPSGEDADAVGQPRDVGSPCASAR
jgi:hypothetical protein